MNALVEYVYVEDDTQAEMAVEYLSKFDRLGYDTETTGLNIVGGVAKLLLMQLGTEEVTYVFDARKIDTGVLKGILESKKILKILHNAVFDYKITKKACGIWLTNVFDTMLAYRLLTSGYLDDGMGGFIPMGDTRPKKKQWPYKSLDFLCKRYLGQGLDKSVRTSFIDHQVNKEFTAKQIEYAAKDVFVLHPLCDLLSAELAEQGLIETALLEFEFVSAASEMELNGVYINKDKWRVIISACKNKAASVKEDISKDIEHLSEQNTLFGACTINIDSPSQLIECFYKLGFELESTDSKVLKKLNDPLANKILEYRAYDKLTKTYGESLLAKIERATNRLHYSLLQLGTTTGRVSSEKPNIQNIPQDREDEEVSISFRECFEAEEGNVILTADYSQCVVKDEPISSQWGLVPIEDFQHSGFITISSCTLGEISEDKVGHKVPSYREKGMVKTDFSLSKGVKETITVITVDGFELNCTPDHVVKVVDNLGNESWKQAHRLTESDNLVLSRDWVCSDRHTSIDYNEEEALFFGYFIGDGSFSGGGIQIAKGEEKYNDVYSTLSDICIKNFYKELKNYPGTNSWDLIGKQFHDLWEHAGIKREWTSHTKEVPSSILKGGRSLISSFLRGLFEADGWVVNNNSNHVVAFSTRSKKLSRQVQLLLLSLGVFSKRASYFEETVLKGKKYSGIQWRVSICDSFNIKSFHEQVGFISEMKTKILESLLNNTHTSYSDYVILDSKDKENLYSLSSIRNNHDVLCRKFFSNYFNSNNEFIRHYSRTKLEEVCQELGSSVPKEHLAFSKVSKIIEGSLQEVYDISVPSQHMFVAGGIFVHNCELRILAEVSGDKKFLEIFEQGGDLHLITAQEVFGISAAEIEMYGLVKKKDRPDVYLPESFSTEEIGTYHKISELRGKTKTINFGIVYGLSAWNLASTFKIPEDEAEELLSNYFKTYSGIKRFLDKNGRETVINRFSKTILGRKRYYTLADPSDDGAFRSSKRATMRAGNNQVIQGANADITKEALIRLQEAYRNIPGAKLLFTVHDEIVSEVPKDKAEEIAEIKADIMAKAFHRFIKNVPVGTDDKVSVTIASHWTK